MLCACAPRRVFFSTWLRTTGRRLGRGDGRARVQLHARRQLERPNVLRQLLPQLRDDAGVQDGWVPPRLQKPTHPGVLHPANLANLAKGNDLCFFFRAQRRCCASGGVFATARVLHTAWHKLSILVKR